MSAGDLDAIFSALADPTRRHVLERLGERGPATPTELAGELPITRQAVSKHLASLDRAGLVARDRCGREARYRASAASLTEALGWLARMGSAWDARLAALETLLEEG